MEHARIPALRTLGWIPTLAVLAAGALFVELIAIVVVTATISRGNPVGDWVSFYAAGTLVREGNGALLFDAASQGAAQRAIFDRDLVTNGYPLPAFVACVFAPLTWLTFVQSYWVWFGINGAALVTLGAWARGQLRGVEPKLRCLMLAAAALSTPVMYVMVLGQIDFFVVGSLLGCYTLLRRDAPFSAGCVLALGVAKPHLIAAAVLLLIIKGEWRALGGLAAVAVPLLGAPVLFFGPGVLVDQARLIFAYPASSSDYNVAAGMMVNVRGTIVSVVPDAPVLLWLVPLALVGTGALIVTARVWRRIDVTAPQAWALVLILPLLYSPHVHIQTMTLLVAAGVLFVAAQDARRSSTRPEHVLLAFAGIVALWLLSIVGVSALVLFSLAGFAIAVRAWPAADAASLSDAGEAEALRAA